MVTRWFTQLVCNHDDTVGAHAVRDCHAAVIGMPSSRTGCAPADGNYRLSDNVSACTLPMCMRLTNNEKASLPASP